MIALLVIAGLNTAISLVYYLRVAKTMCIDEQPEARGAVSFGFLPAAYVLVISLPVMILGVLPDGVARWAQEAARHLLS